VRLKLKDTSKMKYLTMMGLTVTENFGSQLSQFCCMYAIGQKTGHRLVFLDQYAGLGRVLKFHLPFEKLPFEVLDVAQLSDEDRVYSNFQVNLQVPINSEVFALSKDINVNFQGFFTSYRYWYPIRNEIRKMIRFLPSVVMRAEALLQPLRSLGRKLVAVHVRRADYLDHGAMAFNPSAAYYEAAFSQYAEEPSLFIVFSDDIAWCKEAFGKHANVVYSESNPPEVDMCAMTLCDHNIIANSTFSFWGAFLNTNPQKKVVCPGKYMKTDNVIAHMNYCWFPDDFIPLSVE
jgi:hypothetical protein